ncbi:MAG TPA: hypothetical protein VIO64_20205 [Pseudobacteroides sp.]|uniref:hypothetical protein n=1 Tax=Pseudobacteroides sp. TaxID=1968840 RepID=UPI002F931F40
MPWIGDISGLDNAYSSSVKLTMSITCTCIRANYIDANATIVPPTPTKFATPTPTEAKTYTVSGYVKHDFNFAQSSGELINSGFSIELEDTGLKAMTDTKGYFEIKNVPLNTNGYTVKISKINYLSREIRNVSVRGNIELFSSINPIALWAGDISKGGVQDGAINISDVIIIATHFNATVSSYPDVGM